MSNLEEKKLPASLSFKTVLERTLSSWEFLFQGEVVEQEACQ